MAKNIVVTSGKGGVGKTTIVANIGAGLAALNKKVALIDADIGLRNLDIIMGLENRIVYDICDVIEGNCKLKQALIRDRRFNNLYLLPAAQTRDKEAVTPEQMKELADELSKEFDYVIIDSPAGIDRGFRNAVQAANEVILVTTPEVASIRDADRVIGILESYEIENIRLIINRVQPQMIKKSNMLTVDDVVDILGINLLGVIPEDNQVIISTNKGEQVILNDNAKSAQAFKNIVRRVDGQNVPIDEHIKFETFWEKIKRLFSSKKNK